MARNEAYLGHTVRGKRAKSKYLDNTERARCKNTHEPMITPEESAKIQELIASRTFDAASPRSPGSPSIFSGRVFCGKPHNDDNSDYGMTAHKNTNGTRSLICAKKRKRLAKACSNDDANLQDLQNAVIGNMLDRVFSPSFLEEQVKIVAEKAKHRVKQDELEARSLTSRITSIRTRKANLLEQIERFGPQKDTNERLDELTAEQNQLSTKLAIQEERGKSRAMFVNEPERIITNAMDKKTYLETKDPQKLKQLMNIFVRRLTIIDKQVTIEYEIPIPPKDGGPPETSATISFDLSLCPSDSLMGISPVKRQTFQYSFLLPRPLTQ